MQSFYDPVSFLEFLKSARESPDLVLLDVHFENAGLSGIDILPFIREDQPYLPVILLTGPLEPTNEPYAIAKIVGIRMCDAYNRQYGTNFIAAMPTNLYGPGDNYEKETSHVLPALIRRFHEAKVEGRNRVTCWGSGTPRREFLYSEDLAAAIVAVADPMAPQRKVLEKFGVRCVAHASELAPFLNEDTQLMLAVKPQMFNDAAKDATALLDTSRVVISIIGIVRCGFLEFFHALSNTTH